jgi:hypothetical protein
VHSDKIDAVGHQPACLDIVFEDEHGGEPLLNRKTGDKPLATGEIRAGLHKQHLRRALRQDMERLIEIVGRIFELHAAQLQIHLRCHPLGSRELVGGKSVV